MTDLLRRPMPATVVDLTQALKPVFGPTLAGFGAGLPFDSEDAGNAFWVQAAAAVWLLLEEREIERQTSIESVP